MFAHFRRLLGSADPATVPPPGQVDVARHDTMPTVASIFAPGGGTLPHVGPPGALLPERAALAPAPPGPVTLDFSYRPVGDASNGIEVTALGLARLFDGTGLDPGAFECRQLGAERWVSLAFLRRRAPRPAVVVERPRTIAEVWVEWSAAFTWGLGVGAVSTLVLAVLLF